MQFKVPQNIDLEDKLVGPMTLIQFLYVLGGGILDYLLLVAFGFSILFWVLGIPITIVALALAFLKIQDQPLLHFFTAGLEYLRRPKVRIWMRSGEMPQVIQAPVEKPNTKPVLTHKHIDKSQLEQLAYSLDTRNTPANNPKNFGKITDIYEDILAKGGKIGVSSEQQPNPNR